MAAATTPKLEGVTYRYIGTSADDKPTDSRRSGDSFLEVDTGEIWRWDGLRWNRPVVNDSVPSLLQDIKAELGSIRQHLEILQARL